MASRAFKNRFRNTCCSLPELPFTASEISDRVQLHLDGRLVQLMFDQVQRVLNDAVQIHFDVSSVVEVREKLSNELTISLARKVCLAILSSSLDFCSSPEICLASICA